ncbi:hypothetical protein F5148DRAFT_930893 [Russula earlei]|uniref:Uncharacterized protein n=1 Tax=Russula earlei TaxID=71964 RepID=A0ACC0TS76_9AGAM|nr:hypothetical protein F5148DRAFT_930893 [Russula earlei]
MSSDSRYMYPHQHPHPHPHQHQHQHQHPHQHQQGMTSYDYSSYPHNSYDTPHFSQNPTTTRLMVPPPPLTLSRIRRRLSGTARGGPPSVSPSRRLHPFQIRPFLLPSADRNPRPYTHRHLHLRLRLPRHLHPAPAPAPLSQRVYAASPQPQPNAETRRAAGTPKAVTDPPPQTKRKPREKEMAAPRHPSPLASSTPIDFGKLIESYRIIIDTTTAFSTDPASGQGRPPSLEALQRISQSAALGLRLLGSTLGPEPPGPIPPADAPGANPGSVDDGDAAAKRQKADAPVPEGQTCLGCNATSTPEWRRGPLGPRTLCNACGLVYAKLIKKRKRDAARRAANSQETNDGAPADEAGYASSGDEDESASQEFRMEDDHGGRG